MVDEHIYVFVAAPVYVYKETDGKYAGQMLEKSLRHTFLAYSYKEAIESAIAWAKNRYEAYIKDTYAESFFSSIKVSVLSIEPIDDDGTGNTHNQGAFFEWKYDWPGTLEYYVKKAKERDGIELFPGV